ncbi:hypothetical protein [Devosia aurantiaca]|uniref:Uncharacterized protein n=1 Tax=Devosia aurantiaca TaxID=2714858 RepID=A0A6M1SLW0_9HYPH|nr:hypothetical protein [Devosia aurantiaca]NGP16522.1 hypothetical protein [Devosia aurantiaca]
MRAGDIYSPAGFSHAVLIHQNHQPLEVHLGIRVAGRSGVEHEMDVVALDGAEAIAARRDRRAPSWRHVRVHAECKVYADKLSLPLGRQMWGLSADCRLRLKGGLVSNAGRTDSISNLLGKHGTYYRSDVEPNTPGMFELDRDLRDRFERI